MLPKNRKYRNEDYDKDAVFVVEENDREYTNDYEEANPASSEDEETGEGLLDAWDGGF